MLTLSHFNGLQGFTIISFKRKSSFKIVHSFSFSNRYRRSRWPLMTVIYRGPSLLIGLQCVSLHTMEIILYGSLILVISWNRKGSFIQLVVNLLSCCHLHWKKNPYNLRCFTWQLWVPGKCSKFHSGTFVKCALKGWFAKPPLWNLRHSTWHSSCQVKHRKCYVFFLQCWLRMWPRTAVMLFYVFYPFNFLNHF